LTDVGDLASGEQVRARRRRQYLRAVAQVRKHTLHDPLRAPVQVSKEDRDLVAFLARKWLWLVSPVGLRTTSSRRLDAARLCGLGVSGDNDWNIGQ